MVRDADEVVRGFLFYGLPCGGQFSFLAHRIVVHVVPGAARTDCECVRRVGRMNMLFAKIDILQWIGGLGSLVGATGFTDGAAVRGDCVAHHANQGQ